MCLASGESVWVGKISNRVEIYIISFQSYTAIKFSEIQN